MEVVQSSQRTSRTAGLIWGMAKAGKTTLLTSLPGKKVFFMCDPDGDASIADHDDIFIMRLHEYEPEEMINVLTNRIPKFIRRNEGEFTSFIFDSLTAINEAALIKAINKGIGKSNKFTPTLEAPGLSAYGARKSYVLEIVNSALRATGAVGGHCWFTAHQDEPTTDDDGNFLGITLTLSGKTTNGIAKDVSEIWHLRIHNSKWYIAIAPCRNKEPMGSRMFEMSGSPEFVLKFDPSLGTDQPHSIATWFNRWVEGGKKKLPLPTEKDK